VAENNDTERTEDPTQKRLDDAHAKGDVAKSQEVNTWFVIAGATLVLSTFSATMGGGILVPMRSLIANSWMIRTDGQGLLILAQHIEYALIAAIGVPFLMLMPKFGAALLALGIVLAWSGRHVTRVRMVDE
jgi:flagellar biosynthetic protein FlhB